MYLREMYIAIRARLGSRHFCDISAATTRLPHASLRVFARQVALNGTDFAESPSTKFSTKVTRTTSLTHREIIRLLNRGISDR